MLPTLSVDGRAPAILLAMPFLGMGGAEASLSQLCRELAGSGFRIFVITTVPLMESQGDTTSWFADSAADIHHLPQSLDVSLWPEFIFNLIEQQGIQVIWQAGSSYLYDLLPQIRQRFPRTAIADLLFNPVGHGAEHLQYSQTIDHAVVEYEGMREWLVQRGRPGNTISVIPNGVDLVKYSPQPRSSDGPFTAAFLGRLSEEKAPDVFLDIAAASEPAMQFVIAGAGVMEQQLRAAVQERGLAGRVLFPGFAITRDVLRYCDAVVVCSRLDGRPNIVMESLAMGVPVVASRVGAIPEMAGQGSGAILCDAGDVAAFAGALRLLATNKELHRRYSAEARAHAESHFSAALAAESYAALFRRLAQRRSHGALPAAETAKPTPRNYFRNAYLLWNLRGQLTQEFDPKYYRRMYPDVAASRIPPLLHYVFAGFREGRNPSPRFDTRYYLAMNPDVARSGLNPLLHYLAFGRAEKRLCGECR